MSKVLVIDWDRYEIRAVFVDKGVTGLRSLRLVAVPLDSSNNAGDIGSRLAAELNAGSLAKAQTVVTLGRHHVQLRRLQLPPAPAAELPDMVRFQVEREIVALAPDSILDYVPVSGNERTPYQVLAATLESKDRKAVDTLCGALHTAPNQITLRACSAVSMLGRMDGFGSSAPALLACTFADHAELIVVDDGRVVMVRTIRLPASDDQITALHEAETMAESELLRSPTDASLQGLMAAGLNPREASLTSQVRRTLGAASQQLAGRSVEQVFVAAGDGLSHSQLRLMSDQLGAPCNRFDPIAVAASTVEIERGKSDTALDSARFSGVLGAALDASEGRAPLIDFLHPRRPLEKRKIERVHVLAAAAAAVILLVGTWYLYERWAAPAREIANLQVEIDGIQKVVDEYADVRSQATLVEAWMATDINWLDELERTSRGIRPEPLDSDEFPQERDVVLTNLNLQGNSGFNGSGGRILIYGNGRSEDVVPPVEARLRDVRHLVTNGSIGSGSGGRGAGSSTAAEGYSTSFELFVEVLPEDNEELAAP